MGGQFIDTLVFGMLAGAATLGGIYMLLARRSWTRRNTVFFISFSAGVVLSVAFVHLLPEAVELTDNAMAVVLATMLAFYMVEHMLAIHTCHEGECEVHSMGLPAFLGITFHSLLDGAVIGVGFEADFTLGFAAAVAVLLHEIPEGVTITSLLLHAGYDRTRTLVMGWTVAMATPVGALAAFFLIDDPSPSVLGTLLAVAAGSFIYIAASDLLPETHKNMRRSNIVLVLAGVFLVYLTTYLRGGA
ncbi:MAG TPA: ZIP family metal transporter [Deltaproteobacteria bacterium]|nr:ZIP family metal transporter [Deltaproteobacteria bacterium]